MRRTVFFIFKLSMSIALIAFLYRKTPIADIKSLFADIDTTYLPVIGVLLFANTIISARKWQLFLQADGVSMSLTDLTISYMSGTFCNLFLPSSIGGDSFRVYDIARKSKDGMRSAASVFADRFSGFISLVILSLVSSIYVALQYGAIRLIILPLALFIGFILILILLVKQDPVRKILKFTGLERFNTIKRLSEKFLLSINRYGSDRKMVGKVMILSFAFQFSVITVVYLMACSLNAEVAFFYFSAFVPLITLMEALPISIYGIGVRDYGYVFFFTQAGMSDIETRTLALFFMAMAVCYSLIGGLFFLYRVWLEPQRKSDDNNQERTNSN